METFWETDHRVKSRGTKSEAQIPRAGAQIYPSTKGRAQQETFFKGTSHLPSVANETAALPKHITAGLRSAPRCRSSLGSWSIRNAVTSVAENQDRNRRAGVASVPAPNPPLVHGACLRNRRALATGS